MKRRDWTLTDGEALLIGALVALVVVLGVAWYVVRYGYPFTE